MCRRREALGAADADVRQGSGVMRYAGHWCDAGRQQVALIDRHAGGRLLPGGVADAEAAEHAGTGREGGVAFEEEGVVGAGRAGGGVRLHFGGAFQHAGGAGDFARDDSVVRGVIKSAEAVAKTGSSDADKIIGYWNTLQMWLGLYGHYSFSPTEHNGFLGTDVVMSKANTQRHC